VGGLTQVCPLERKERNIPSFGEVLKLLIRSSFSASLCGRVPDFMWVHKISLDGMETKVMLRKVMTGKHRRNVAGDKNKARFTLLAPLISLYD
jgi:hypothetical protein